MNPKLQAISLLRTWLDECNIPYSASGEMLAIKTANGEMPVNFNPRAVMSTDLNISIGEFHRLTSEAGYGMPMPVARGSAPKKRMFGDTILARWRHNEMRTVPNASTADLRAHDDVALREARIFVGRNKYLCREMGYDVDIAHNDALIWTNTFLGRYRLRDEQENDNKKLLTNYLRQRFKEMRDGMLRERRNVTPGDSYESFVISQSAEGPEEEWKAAHNEIQETSINKRRVRARELLTTNLESMEHGAMVEVLREVAESHPCFDTRKAANKYLKTHSAECAECLEETRRIEMNENVA